MDYVVGKLRELRTSPRKASKNIKSHNSPRQSPCKGQEKHVQSRNYSPYKDQQSSEHVLCPKSSKLFGTKNSPRKSPCKGRQSEENSPQKFKLPRKYSPYKEQQSSEHVLCPKSSKLFGTKNSPGQSPCKGRQSEENSPQKYKQPGEYSPRKDKQSSWHILCRGSPKLFGRKHSPGQSPCKGRQNSENSPQKYKQSGEHSLWEVQQTSRYGLCNTQQITEQLSYKSQEKTRFHLFKNHLPEGQVPIKTQHTLEQSPPKYQQILDNSPSKNQQKTKRYLYRHQETIGHSLNKAQQTIECSPRESSSGNSRSKVRISFDCSEYSPINSPKHILKKHNLFESSPIKTQKLHQYSLQTQELCPRSPKNLLSMCHHSSIKSRALPSTIKFLYNKSSTHFFHSHDVSSFTSSDCCKHSQSPFKYRGSSKSDKRHSFKELPSKYFPVLYSTPPWKANSIERLNKVSLSRPLNLYYHDEDITTWYSQSEFVTSCLQWHNIFRDFHGSPLLVLSHQIINLIFYKYSSHNFLFLGDQVARYWYQEIKFYDFYQKPSLLHVKAGHFTQMIWRNTQEFGIGKARTRSGKIVVVANYRPAGNVIGHFHQNVFPPVKNKEK
ncbi:uncharacterized protein LOC111085548 [Limulus polyphemus]|uniref:Uncharacterized protein LOC111085548 n=1 Tax=Limulus polyphemus TaxID=6850 RepID=A0ABM1S9N7_LIMPO|nr:uncharacterized protein LOC111085548 [Limulus polyphemus]